MGQIEWAMWANEQAVVSALILLTGGIIGVAGMFENWQFAAFCIPAALLILFIEWPRSKRLKGNTIERKFQKHLTPCLIRLGPIIKNYYVRFLLHLLLSVPACFLLPTIMGGICLVISSIIYFTAAWKGEEWKPMREKPKPTVSEMNDNPLQPPSRPPPRLPPQVETRY